MTLLQFTFEAESLGTTNKCYEVLSRQVQARKTSNVQTIVESFRVVVDNVGLTMNFLTSHSEYH
jgi:hypothetical protein